MTSATLSGLEVGTTSTCSLVTLTPILHVTITYFVYNTAHISYPLCFLQPGRRFYYHQHFYSGRGVWARFGFRTSGF